jgi:transcriptional/translational regulatory protein YebC/TACO1
MLEAAIEAGADECISADETHTFLSGVDGYAQVREALEAKLGVPEAAAIEWRPQNTFPVPD